MQLYWLMHKIWFLFRFSFTDGSYGKIVILSGADMSSSVHIDNKGRDILMLAEGPTPGLGVTTLTRIQH